MASTNQSSEEYDPFGMATTTTSSSTLPTSQQQQLQGLHQQQWQQPQRYGHRQPGPQMYGVMHTQQLHWMALQQQQQQALLLQQLQLQQQQQQREAAEAEEARERQWMRDFIDRHGPPAAISESNLVAESSWQWTIAQTKSRLRSLLALSSELESVTLALERLQAEQASSTTTTSNQGDLESEAARLIARSRELEAEIRTAKAVFDSDADGFAAFQVLAHKHNRKQVSTPSNPASRSHHTMN